MAQTSKVNDAESYQVKSARLDELVAALQAQDVSIDEAMKYYEEGVALANELQAYLKTAENKIEKLKPSQASD